jgi:DNA polymerase III alpha subunit
MVYQEDVIKIAHHFAGLELADADTLRRSMSGKGRSREQLLRIQERFFEGCRRKGHSQELSREVWRQIESFAGYSFCKAHSASYAMESFQSLYLKAYYPLEFMVGVINNFGGFYALEHYVHEARMCGARVEPPCVNHSQYLASVKGTTIYLGFVHLKDLEASTAHQLIRERESNGPYRSFADFLQRVPVKKEQLNLLIRINAFRFSGKSRHLLLWEKNNYAHQSPIAASNTTGSGTANSNSGSGGPALSLSLFTDTKEKEGKLPPLDIHQFEDAFEQIELLGFPLCSPFMLLEKKPDSSLRANKLLSHVGQQVAIAGYFVTRKITRTKQGRLMSFGTWIDEEGFFFDSTHFPPALEQYPFRGPGCYRIEGKVVQEFGFPSIEVHKMQHLKMISDARFNS